MSGWRHARKRTRRTLQRRRKDYFFFFGTLAPRLRASDRPIAIACLRLFTFLPERPLRSVPAFRFFIARLTFLAAPFEYLRFLAFFAKSSSQQKNRDGCHPTAAPVSSRTIGTP